MSKKNMISSIILWSIIVIYFNGCKKDEDLQIGQNYQGGIIAYILQKGDPGYDKKVQHGLIIAIKDTCYSSTNPNWVWNCWQNCTTGATATELGTGNSNTNLIFNSQGYGFYAAEVCYSCTWNGYNDWFLPSKDELNKLYINKDAIGVISNSTYWSSSEYFLDIAWCQDFNTGEQKKVFKNAEHKVRPVRNF